MGFYQRCLHHVCLGPLQKSSKDPKWSFPDLKLASKLNSSGGGLFEREPIRDATSYPNSEG